MRIIEFQRSLALKDFYHHLELALLSVYLFDDSDEVLEGAVVYFNALADHVVVDAFGLSLGDFIGSTEHSHHLSLAQPLGLGVLFAATQKVNNIGRVSEFVYDLACENGFDEDVAGIKVFLFDDLFPLRSAITFSVGINT